MTTTANEAALPALPVTPHQAGVAGRALDEEEVARRHLVINLTGAHAYGFPSPDSDLDLKGVHVTPTSRLVGLSRSEPHASRLEVIDGVEIDYASNEVGQVLVGVLQGNGSFIERVLGMWPVRRASEHEALAELVSGALSRRVLGHYQGFATGQLREATAPGATPTAKKVLYVLRTALTGAHLLLSGRLVTDLGALVDEHGFGEARELMALKRTGERVPLPEAARDRWLAEAARAVEHVAAAGGRSCLPEAPPNRDAVEAWLLELRRRCWS